MNASLTVTPHCNQLPGALGATEPFQGRHPARSPRSLTHSTKPDPGSLPCLPPQGSPSLSAIPLLSTPSSLERGVEVTRARPVKERKAPVLQAAPSFLLAGKTPALVTHHLPLSAGSPPTTWVSKGLPLAYPRGMDASLCAEIREGGRRRGLFSPFQRCLCRWELGDRQVLLGAPPCSSMSHRGGCLALLLSICCCFSRCLCGGCLGGSRDVLAACWEIKALAN